MHQADRTLSLLAPLATDAKVLQRLLSPGRVTVVLASDVADLPQAQLLLSFTVNLLSRLYPVVQELRILVPERVALRAAVPRWSASTLAGHIRAFLEALHPPLRWNVEDPAAGAAKGLQLTTLSLSPSGGASFYMGSDGWEACLSLTKPVEIGKEVNPVGAFAAACLGVAEVWKRHLYPHRRLLPGIPVVPLDSDLWFSTFTYLAGPGQINPAIPDGIDLERLTLAGTGAGGGAVAFTLASLTTVKGLINLVDPDVVYEPNLNRYVYADAGDAASTRHKVVILQSLFERHSELTVRPLSEPYVQALDKLSGRDREYVLAAMHSREARRNVQYETPRVLWDAAASETGEFFIWRLVLGRTECMFCKHPQGPEDVEHQKAAQLMRLLGLDQDIWLSKLRDNDEFQLDEVDAIVTHLGDSNIDFALPAVGQRFGDWEAAQCGLLQLPELDDEIPVPFAPVLAGVLLAGEVIKERLFPNAVLDSYYWNTLVGNFMRRNQPNRRGPRAECSFCQDSAYLGQYRRRWVSK